MGLSYTPRQQRNLAQIPSSATISAAEGGIFQVGVPERAKKIIEKQRRLRNDGFAKTALFQGVNLVTSDAVRQYIAVTQDLPKPTCVSSTLDSCFIEAGFTLGRFTAFEPEPSSPQALRASPATV